MSDEPDMELQNFGNGVGVSWRWRRGSYFSQAFSSEEEAIEAANDELLEFNRPDGGDAVVDLYAKREAETGCGGPYDYWLVGEHVLEPMLGGNQLGMLPECKIPACASILRMSQDEFDVLMEDFRDQYGYYPGT